MLVDANVEGGLFTGLEARSALETPTTWACGCAACAAMSLPGQSGSIAGEFATTPADNAYGYVALTPVTGGGDIAALMSGTKWTSQDASAKTVITYSFASPQQSSYYYTSNTEYVATLASFSEADKTLTRSLLANIESVCNVDFVEVADNASECGVLRYGYSQQPNAINAGGYAFFPSSVAAGGDIWIGAAQAATQWDFYRPNLILHETLHAIGLKHPFSTGAVLSTQENIIPNTVMSYSPIAGGTSGWMSKYPNEPMALDIAALQHLYGAAATNGGNTVYDLAGADFQGGFNAVWDAGGTDLFDASRLGRAVTLDLAEAALSDVGVSISATAKQNGANISATYTRTLSIADGAVIENAIGTAFADRITGNAVANFLAGGAGNDLLEGLAGNDTLEGGAGRDTAVIAASRSGYGIAKAGNGYNVSGGATGTDSLTGVERIAFTDAHVALDLDGNAGTVVKIFGAVLGAWNASNAAYVGIGLGALDAGMGAETLAQLVINARLGAGASNDAVVKLLFNNIAGFTPPADYLASYVEMLDSGACTPGQMTVAAAQHEVNLANIDLVGLAATGLEYIG